MNVDIDRIAADKAHQLSGESDHWRVVLSVVGRLYASIDVGWIRWSKWRQPIADAIRGVFVLAGGASPADAEDLAMALQGFDVEDDGGSEWQALVDMFDLCAAALTGLPPDQLSDKGVRLLLEAAFTQVTNQESEVRGRPLFQPEAEEFVVTSLVWERACDFVRSV